MAVVTPECQRQKWIYNGYVNAIRMKEENIR